MKPRDFLRKLDDAQVVKAIQAAENSSSGEIRVFVTNRSVGPQEVVRRATARFKKLGMTNTRHRNAILLYFAPRARQFAVVGDERIHAKCGHAFWNGVVARTCAALREGEFTAAVVGAIRMAGEVLACHFPRLPDDRNELPNEVGRD
jgi:uncharacterized membrane protein